MEKNPDVITKESILSLLEPVIRNHFRPEFVNRLDEILPFLPLQQKDMKQIVEIQLGHLVKRMHEREATLTWDDPVLNHLAEKGYDPAFGARPLKRLIQHEVVNMLSKAVLEGKIPAGSKVHLKMNDQTVQFNVS